TLQNYFFNFVQLFRGVRQDKVKENDNNKDKDKEKDNNKDKEKEKENQGNHYGQNKGDLQGKDFGQHRAEEAKSKNDFVTESEDNISVTDQNNVATRDKIKQAREKLELKKKNKEITDVDYQKKKKALDDLETQVNELEKQSKDVKDKLDTEKKKE
ncbi:MAG TPA: hypothetical protein PKK00_14980, partial [Bacteroidales bacterium]|nr:hypothetical protein [Bacteroidales bacterium]HPS18503.1 hypothetical protein [Bacteroidales bacterium]